jgi:uncharacterized protein YndB with AHSA1/START domain
VGGRYRFAMQRESGARVLTVHGRFLEIRPPEKLVYTWRWDGAFPDMPETRVTVEFCAVDGGTELALRQEPVNLRVCAQHLSGWLAACDRIARTLGDPLPQTRPADATLIGSLA